MAGTTRHAPSAANAEVAAERLASVPAASDEDAISKCNSAVRKNTQILGSHLARQDRKKSFFVRPSELPRDRSKSMAASCDCSYDRATSESLERSTVSRRRALGQFVGKSVNRPRKKRDSTFTYVPKVEARVRRTWFTRRDQDGRTVLVQVHHLQKKLHTQPSPSAVTYLSSQVLRVCCRRFARRWRRASTRRRWRVARPRLVFSMLSRGPTRQATPVAAEEQPVTSAACEPVRVAASRSQSSRTVARATAPSRLTAAASPAASATHT